MTRARSALLMVGLLALTARVAGADDAVPPGADAPATSPVAAIDSPSPAPLVPASHHSGKRELEPLVPELAGDPYRMAAGPRQFEHRVSVSPAFGAFGSDQLFALRLAYNPTSWLGYEASIGHDAGSAVHALLHSISVVMRKPLPGRLQPFISTGYGMMIVYPGQSLNADPVTKNALTLGGGLELYVRSDLALRGDARYATVFGQQRDREGIVAYDYLEGTIGLAFYRTIQP